MNRLGSEKTTYSGDDRARSLSFAPATDGLGVTIIDAIERHQYTVSTPTPVSPTPVDVENFLFPADAGIAFTTETITLPTVVAVYIRDAETGEMLGEAEHFAYQEFPDGEYSVELCAPIKLYLRVSGSLTVTADAAQTSIKFGGETKVLFGGRSHHEHPAATITTPADPHAMMQAVSMFGSALKTTSCERSYPTLRGHPPTIELGDELHIPEALDAPDTGIRIELPAERAAVYVAAPLAYYLGATLVEGETPRIVTDTGFEHRLDTARGFEAEVERVLKQTFFLDCLTRTEGYYQVDLHERQTLESQIDLDFAALYDQPLQEQLEAYLAVPFTAVEDQLPEWKLTTHVELTPTSVETLPFVVNDLAVVQTPQQITPIAESEPQLTAVDDFLRTEQDEFTRSAGTTSTTPESYVQPESSSSLEQTWVGEQTPIGASKATAEAFQNRLDRTPTTGDIDITVVCNDAEMSEERDIVNEVYGSREDLPFTVTVKHGLMTDELRQILTSDTDFLHYIGHIDDDGFDCADGMFDAKTLETVDVDAFLLNACQSYTQGMHLLESGSIGGVVTLSDVINSGAVRIGRTMARLLNTGFPLRAALKIAQEESIIGGKYIVIGDGGTAITLPENGTPNLCEIESRGERFLVEYKTYPTTQRGMGSLVIPIMEGNDSHFLSSGSLDTFEMSKPELAQFLSLENIPVKIDGQLYWSDSVDVEEL